MDPVAALLLAAGFSRRFGADKRLHPVDGRPMIARAAARYLEQFQTLFAVLRPGDEAIGALLEPLGAVPVFAREAAQGMGRSLAAGIEAIGERAHVVVGLADMPFVAAGTLRRLRGMLGPGRIVRPMYRGAPGHPVGFSQDYFGELRQLRGDRGAKEVVARHPDALVQWWEADSGVVRDIDVPPP